MSDAVVELDAFSGRPNPRWHLSEGAFSALKEGLEQLGQAPSAVEPPRQLGYRGLSVTPAAHGDSDWQLYIGGGYAFVTEGGRLSVLVDRDRQLERQLLNSGKNAVDESLLQEILNGLR